MSPNPAPEPRAASWPRTHRSVAVPELTNEEFDRLRRLIHQQSGLSLSDSKKSLLVRRLRNRLTTLGLKSWCEYLELVTSSPADELVEMLDCVLTNETSFFRESRQFDYLEQEVLPAWQSEAARGRRPRCVRAWSAACATGEEAYSLAMLLGSRWLGAEGWSLEVLASDLSARALAFARHAVYSGERLTLPERHLKRFMLRGKGGQSGKVRVSPEIRRLVQFARVNLVKRPLEVDGEFDLILCRNVLIYFDQPTKRRVAEALLARLGPGGLLLVGHAESLSTITRRARSIVPMVYRDAWSRQRVGSPRH